jgi:hypothetical protein
LALQSERFTLWASSLGLFQVGHASLDYRLRDADVVRQYISDVLLELNEYLSDSTYNTESFVALPLTAESPMLLPECGHLWRMQHLEYERW